MLINEEKGLQIVDLISGSFFFQSLEYDNSDYIDLIRTKNLIEVFK